MKKNGSDGLDRSAIDPTRQDSAPDLLDLREMVRSLQRQEGYQDCYQRSEEICAREDCIWGPWCQPLTFPPKEQ